MKKIAPPSSLYHAVKVKIPEPKFVVFYNGKAKQPERQIYKLSDLFCHKEKEPELELKVTVININPGYNKELMENCESLRGYMAFVGKVRNKKEAEIQPEEAVRQAVDECISEDILADFFSGHKEEIVEMSIYEFNQELHDKVLLEDGEAIGLEKGVEIGTVRAIENLMETLKLTIEQAMEALKIPENEREKYRDRLENNKNKTADDLSHALGVYSTFL